MMDLFQLLSVIAVIFLALYYYYTSTFDFWRSRGVPGPRPIPVFGNVKDVMLARVMLGVYAQQQYEKYKNEPMFGMFMRSSPVLVLCDLDLIKDVLIKDFQAFPGRGTYVNDKIDPISANLFNLEAERWRPLRSRMSPVFTTGKMKEMFPLIAECAEQLEKYLEKLSETDEPVEVREIAAKFTTDVIGSCAFGINMNALSNEESEFRRIGKSVFAPGFFKLLKFSIRDTSPWLSNLISSVLPQAESTVFFTKVISETMDYRKKNDIRRPDFVNLLMELKDNPHKLENIELTDGLLTAQAFVFFAAGFETSSTTIGHTLYEMALNPEMQSKLREEIKEFASKNNGEIKYEDVKEMKYLDKVFKETLRKYPPATLLRRQAKTNYTFDGTKVSIPKDTKVLIPVYAIHHDPNIYPSPEVFDPERFTDEAVAARHSMTFLPFGDGPRNCIGARFARYQTKVGLIKMLQNFKVDVCEKTLIPYVNNPAALVLAPKGGIYLKISKLHN